MCQNCSKYFIIQHIVSLKCIKGYKCFFPSPVWRNKKQTNKNNSFSSISAWTPEKNALCGLYCICKKKTEATLCLRQLKREMSEKWGDGSGMKNVR